LARKILLADDSVTAQNMGRKILADAGYEVITVNNGSAALKKIAELKPDLVILDVYMPGYSGLEVCQRLKESQETARIPVLLTVGKLEPFKPEEAQRVRAEGFIVKPFEASELLSALSKLEDKVVPRAEPSKPGRFARAIAAAEESGRISKNDATSDDDGWKSRIGFPRQKTAQEQAADEVPIYNPVNRDLRTIVGSPTPQKAENKEEKQQATAETVDVAALAPPGLPQNVMPQDVTPEEVAAIAAAAAHIQMAAAIKDEQDASAAESSAPHVAERMDAIDTSSDVQASAAYAVNAPVVSAPAVNPEGRSEAVTGNNEGAAYEAAKSETEFPRDLKESSQESQDVPVTMAAAAETINAGNETAARWTAVSVALEADEAMISLEHEMQKAYSAFVAEETTASNSTAVSEIAPPESASAAPEATQETQPDAISNSERQPAPQAEFVESADASPIERAEVSMAESSIAEASIAGSKPAESQPVPLSDAPADPSIDAAPSSATETATAAIAQSDSARVETSEPVPVEAMAAPSASEPSPEIVAELPDAAIATAAVPQELPPVVDSEAAMTEPSAPSYDSAAMIHNERGEDRKEDSETVKSTAAAWASWRQIRDNGDAKPETAEPAREEFNVSEPARSESAAMAAAAGAEQNGQDTAAPPAENPTDVASIVESVLADLRPRLMAEITRKMSEKK
jgi:two-component system, chemotaxis family, chemotaxis protein CheY